jgi:gamma-glutamyltranspeptidase/glutathione hydrolase
MYHAGIGGGGFLLVRDPSGAHEVIDFREVAPASAHENMFRGNSNGSMYGGLAVAVPGEVRGLEYAHARYGRLPWKTVLQGAIHIARDGFVVSKDLVMYMHRSIAVNGGGRNFLEEDPEFAKDFAPSGKLVVEGEIITRKRYADTLELIGEHGAEAFYSGAVAESMIATIQAHNGTMTLDDLREYNITIREPVTTTFRNKFRLLSAPAPASGSVALQILKIMELFPSTKPFFDPSSSSPTVDADEKAHQQHLNIHRLDEAMRFAYAARLHLADPAFVQSAADLEARMLSPETLKNIHAHLRDDTTQPVEAYNPDKVYAAETQGTSHIVAADADGMAASITTTINSLFGSLLVDPLSGVILNNEMDDFGKPGERNFFDLEPSPENYIRPGKKPFSSISPIIVERLDEKDDSKSSFFLAIGAAGGSRIATSAAQVAWRVMEHGATIGAAIEAPRIHDQLIPNVTSLEWAFDDETARSLEERGHEVVWTKLNLSAVQGLALGEDGVFDAAGESRQLNSGGYVV